MAHAAVWAGGSNDIPSGGHGSIQRLCGLVPEFLHASECSRCSPSARGAEQLSTPLLPVRRIRWPTVWRGKSCLRIRGWRGTGGCAEVAAVGCLFRRNSCKHRARGCVTIGFLQAAATQCAAQHVDCLCGSWLARRRKLITDAARELHNCHMARFDERSGNLYVTGVLHCVRWKDYSSACCCKQPVCHRWAAAAVHPLLGLFWCLLLQTTCMSQVRCCGNPSPARVVLVPAAANVSQVCCCSTEPAVSG